MTLDSFEQGLLTELRGHVAERATSHHPASRPARRRWRWATVPVAAAGAAIALGVALMQPSAAYAVTESGGDVVVTISRLDDADGLEQALADHGIDAEVDYTAEPDLPPPGTGTHHESGTDDGPSFSSSGGTSGGAPGGTSGADVGPAIRSSLSKDAFTLELDPTAIPDGMILHITTSGTLGGLAGLQVQLTPAD